MHRLICTLFFRQLRVVCRLVVGLQLVLLGKTSVGLQLVLLEKNSGKQNTESTNKTTAKYEPTTWCPLQNIINLFALSRVFCCFCIIIVGADYKKNSDEGGKSRKRKKRKTKNAKKVGRKAQILKQASKKIVLKASP